MAGTFSVGCSVVSRGRDEQARPRGERTVQVSVGSVNGFSGTVDLVYTSSPSSPAVVLSKSGAQVYVPKNGTTNDTVIVNLVSANSCHFYGTGTHEQTTVQCDVLVTQNLRDDEAQAVPRKAAPSSR